jgi:flagellar basal-body rod protein FlgG
MKVMSAAGSPISSTEGVMTIRDGGVVTVNGNEVGTVKVVTFGDKSKLQKEGFYRFEWTGSEDQAKDVPEPVVKGGVLEGSNVNSVGEMVRLMSATRDFESVQRAVKIMTTDMNSKLIEALGKLG